MRILIVVALIGLVVVFFVAFFRPRKSRKVQETVKEQTDKWSDRAAERAGKAGDAPAETIEKVGHATEQVEHGGRRAHDKVFRSSTGAERDRDLERRHGHGADRGDED